MEFCLECRGWIHRGGDGMGMGVGWMDGRMDGLYGKHMGRPACYTTLLGRPPSSSLAFLFYYLSLFPSLLFFPLCHFDAHVCLSPSVSLASKRTLLCVIITSGWVCFAWSGWMELGSCYLIFDSFAELYLPTYRTVRYTALLLSWLGGLLGGEVWE